MNLLFVCMGNICRSPTVEAVARVEFAKAGLDIEVASAGTESYHIGDRADPRSIAMAEANGYPMSSHRARQVGPADFSRFDHLLVMDQTNLRALLAMAPDNARDRVAMFLPFVGISKPVELPDPYYGTSRDFEVALELARDGIMALIDRIAG
ncbi:MAG: low molecular weight protein-tyrosine-phosphatase [Dokdonella sp.]